jgi:hypothetical protein
MAQELKKSFFNLTNDRYRAQDVRLGIPYTSKLSDCQGGAALRQAKWVHGWFFGTAVAQESLGPDSQPHKNHFISLRRKYADL